MTGEVGVVELVGVADALVGHQLEELAAERMRLSRGEIREGHFVGAAYLGLELMDLARKPMGRQPLRPPGAARRLLLTADGHLQLLMSSGELQAVHVHPSSMRLGSWVLLRLVTPRGRQSVLLGPDNTEPAALAALRRRLTSGAAPQHEEVAGPGLAAPVRYTRGHTGR